MIGVFRRARARAALLAPPTKARVQSLPPGRRSQAAYLRTCLTGTGVRRVLGVGEFDPALATALLAVRADIVDHRPANRAANIITDLAVDGAALAGPYDLVLAQNPAEASTRVDRMLPRLAEALAEDGKMVFVTRQPELIEASLGAISGARVSRVPIRSGVGLEVFLR